MSEFVAFLILLGIFGVFVFLQGFVEYWFCYPKKNPRAPDGDNHHRDSGSDGSGVSVASETDK